MSDCFASITRTPARACGTLSSSWYCQSDPPAWGKSKDTAYNNEQPQDGKHECFSMMVVSIMDA